MPEALPLAEIPTKNFAELIEENRADRVERDWTRIPVNVRLAEPTDECLSATVEQVRSNMSGISSVFMESREAGDAAYKSQNEKFKASLQGAILDDESWRKIETNNESLANRHRKDAEARVLQSKQPYVDAASAQLDQHHSMIEGLLHVAPTPEALLEYMSAANPPALKARMEAQAFVSTMDHGALQTMLGVAYSSNNFALAAACASRLGQFPKSKIKPSDIAAKLGIDKLHNRLRAAFDESTELRRIARQILSGKRETSENKISRGLREMQKANA